MSEFWVNSIKIVGLPGLVLYGLYYLMDKIFDEKLTNLLGVDRIFILIIIMLILLASFFFYSTFKTSKKSPDSDNSSQNENDSPAASVEKKSEATYPPEKHQTVVYRDNAKHKGDNTFS
mgnify:CR=1 FL=1